MFPAENHFPLEGLSREWQRWEQWEVRAILYIHHWQPVKTAPTVACSACQAVTWPEGGLWLVLVICTITTPGHQGVVLPTPHHTQHQHHHHSLPGSEGTREGSREGTRQYGEHLQWVQTGEESEDIVCCRTRAPYFPRTTDRVTAHSSCLWLIFHFSARVPGYRGSSSWWPDTTVRPVQIWQICPYHSILSQAAVERVALHIISKYGDLHPNIVVHSPRPIKYYSTGWGHVTKWDSFFRVLSYFHLLL